MSDQPATASDRPGDDDGHDQPDGDDQRVTQGGRSRAARPTRVAGLRPGAGASRSPSAARDLDDQDAGEDHAAATVEIARRHGDRARGEVTSALAPSSSVSRSVGVGVLEAASQVTEGR